MSNLLDANAILRYLLNDIPDQALIVEQAVIKGTCTANEVVAKVVYVLQGVYKLNRKEITDSLLTLLEEIDVLDKAIIRETLKEYAVSLLDYVGCVLYARAKTLKDPLVSFDKKLNKRVAQI